MAYAKIEGFIETLDAGGAKKKTLFSNNFTGATNVLHWELDYDTNAKIVWDPVNWTGFMVTTFERLFLLATTDCDVELTVGEGEATEELNHFTLEANVPFFLGNDTANRNHSASDAFGGTADVIDKIRVKGSASGKLTIALAN